MKKSKSGINYNAKVEVRKMNNILEVKFTNLAYYDPSPKRQRVDKNHYIDLKTGEYKAYENFAQLYFPEDDSDFIRCNDFDKHLKDNDIDVESNDKDSMKATKNKKVNISRLSSPKSLKKTRKLNKELIITNFHSPSRTMFVTFVYKNRIEDTDRVGKDMTNTIDWVRTHYQSNDNKMKYVYVMEYDHTGSIHVHMLFYWDKKFSNDLESGLSKYWKRKGRIHVEPIRDTESITFIAAYLTYGLTDKDVTTNRYDIPNSKDEKQDIKHARLSYFKPYERFFRHSTGMETCEKKEMTLEEAVEEYGLTDYFSSGVFHVDDKRTCTVIDQIYEYHNLKKSIFSSPILHTNNETKKYIQERSVI